MRTPKITLNLGSGSARGLVHIGVLRALEEGKISFDMIIGVSMGAFIGGYYAYYKDIDKMKEAVFRIIHSEEFDESFMSIGNSMKETAKSFLRTVHKIYVRTGMVGRMIMADGILPEDEINGVFYPNYPNISIEDTKIPFACVAVDVDTGKIKLFQKGKLSDAVLASVSIPLIFPPKKIQGTSYVDGFLLDRLGIKSAKSLGAKYIIAVDTSPAVETRKPKIDSALDVIFRSLDIAVSNQLSDEVQKNSIILKPFKKDFHWADFNRHEEIIDIGYEYTRKNISFLRDKLEMTSPWRRFFFFRKEHI